MNIFHSFHVLCVRAPPENQAKEKDNTFNALSILW